MYIPSSDDITYFVYHFETQKRSYHVCLQSFIETGNLCYVRRHFGLFSNPITLQLHDVE